MNVKRLLALTICTMFVFSLIIPGMALAKGENDFTASLAVSDTSVPAGTTVTCSVTVKNTDPTYGCDVSVTTSGGSLIESYYLAAGATRVSTDYVTINSTKSIYYTVHASHGPDINKTKNTNTVTVTVEQNESAEPDDEDDDYTPNDEIIIDTPVPDAEPIHGVPASGSVFIAGFENITYDGMPIEGSCEVMTNHDGTAVMTGDIFYHLPDSIAATYLDRAEEDKCYIYASWRMGALSAEAMDEINEMYILDSDDGVISFSQDIALHDVPIIYDELQDNLILSIDLIDPTDGNRYHDYISIGLVYGPQIDDEYTISLNELYFNGVLITDTDEIIEVEYGTGFTIIQNLSYTINPDELSVHDLYRTRVEVVTHLDGDYPALIYSPYVSIIPESASGDMVYELIADRASYNPGCLDYGMHTLQITARQERDVLPAVDISDAVVLTINVVGTGPVDWGEHIDEDDGAIEMFDGTFYMDFGRWLGLGDYIEMTLDYEEITIAGPGDAAIFGEVSYRSGEEFYIRISYDGHWREHYPGVYRESGTYLYDNIEYAEETATLEILTELIAADDGEVLASDTDYLTINVEPLEERTDYRQRFWLGPETSTIALGEDVTFDYSLSNEITGESVHVQLIDNEDGSIIFEDTDFEPLEMVDTSFARTPESDSLYSFTARVLADDGSILWHQTFEYYIVVMPNHVEDGEDGVFDLDIGAASMEITEGERARIYCTVSYGVHDAHLAAGDIGLIVEDQSGHVLLTEGSVSPGDILGFFEDYYLTDTTTFTITASGTDAHTGAEYTDTESITITVIDDPAPIPPEDYLDISYELYSGPRIISAGDSIEFLARIVNNSTEAVTVVVIKDDGTFLGDEVGYLLPGEVMMAYEAMTFYDSAVLSFRAVAWIHGSTVAFTETKYRAVLVDEELAEGEDAAAEGEYAIDLSVALSTPEIIAGEVADVYIEAQNTGTSPAVIIVSHGEGYVFEAGEETMPGESAVYTMRWSPAETMALTVEARALDGDGLVQCIASETVLLTVVEPPLRPLSPLPLADAAAEIDLRVTPSIAAVERGGSISFDISVENTGEVEFYQYVVSESLTGSHRINDGLATGVTESFAVTQTFTRDTTIIFDVRGYTAEGTLLAMDTQMVTVEIMTVYSEDEIPPFDGGPLPLPEDREESPPSEPADEGMMDSAEPAEDAPAEDAAMDEVFTGGISLSLRPAEEPVGGGRLIIVSIDEETEKANDRVYMMRRIFASLVGLIVITLAAVIVVAAARRHARKREQDSI
jgi:hypothetical protein